MYATAVQLRAYLSQVGSTVPNDTLLTDCLTRATDMVRNALRAVLADPAFDYTIAAASTIIVTGYPTASLSLPAHTIGSVTLVEHETSTTPFTYTAITDVWSEDSSGRLYRPGGWTAQRFRITASWGYGATIPPAIEELTLELAVNLWRAKDKGGYSETVGVDGSGGSLRMVAGLNKQQAQTIHDVAAQLWRVHI